MSMWHVVRRRQGCVGSPIVSWFLVPIQSSRSKSSEYGLICFSFLADATFAGGSDG